MPQAAVNAFSSDPSVEFAEPNWIYTHQATSNDTYYTNGQLWGMYGASTIPANKYGSNAAAAWASPSLQVMANFEGFSYLQNRRKNPQYIHVYRVMTICHFLFYRFYTLVG